MTGETELSRQMRTRARAINKAGGLDQALSGDDPLGGMSAYGS